MQKILVVGRENKQRKAILRLLISEGFEALAIEEAEFDEAAIRQHRPDLLLSLVDLGGGQSFELLDGLKNHSDLAAIPFVMVTNQAENTYFRRCMELGADDYLVVPVKDAELIAAIQRRLLKQSQLVDCYVAVLRNTAEQLNRLAHYDSLTDLPNHHLLQLRLAQAVDRVQQSHQGQFAFLSVSLDRLRQINNLLGYEAGDMLLQTAAQRLRASLPHGTTVARLTGNQFAVVLTNFADRQTVRQIAEDLMHRLSQSFILPGQEVFVTTSIGVAFYPEDSQDIRVLLRQADAALDWAKYQKSNYCQFYRPDMPVVSNDEIVYETWLRYALDRQEFEVFYQPQMSLSGNCISGAEALIRWTHPDQGLISPAQFIPLAEETGLIVSIGEWMLNQTCQQFAAWHQSGYGGMKVSVNLSSVQFNQSHLSRTILEVLVRTGIPPEALELELTETALMQDAETAIRTLHELKQLGIKIAIDDFGTGYSSLSYLKQLPIDTLKIDTCFVQGAEGNTKNRVILTAVIQMAHDLGLKVVAEGVETTGELELLQQLSCDVVQGYYVGQPMAGAQFQALLEKQTMNRRPQGSGRGLCFEELN